MNKLLNQVIGLFKSKAIYYWKPFNRRRLIKFYQPFMEKGDLCFDIGAHIGNRTDAWLALETKVLAIEPQPSCVNYLQKRFGSNPNAIILDQAVGAKTGILPLKISNRHPTVTTLANEKWQRRINLIANNTINWDEEIDIQVVTLDLLIEKYGLPVFCKIDVEGYEAEVLAGLSKAIPNISFEFFNFTPEITLACLKHLDQIGNYVYNWSLGESQKMDLNPWVNSQTLIETIQAFPKKEFSGDIYAKQK